MGMGIPTAGLTKSPQTSTPAQGGKGGYQTTPAQGGKGGYTSTPAQGGKMSPLINQIVSKSPQVLTQPQVGTMGSVVNPQPSVQQPVNPQPLVQQPVNPQLAETVNSLTPRAIEPVATRQFDPKMMQYIQMQQEQQRRQQEMMMRLPPYLRQRYMQQMNQGLMGLQQPVDPRRLAQAPAPGLNGVPGNQNPLYFGPGYK